MIIFALLLSITSFNYLLCDEIALGSEDGDSLQVDLSERFCSSEPHGGDQSCSGRVSESESYDYLRKYGYLPEDKSMADITSSEYSEALVEFQHFFKIKVTGVLDNKTIEVMKRERCSEPDFRHNKVKRRSKRSLSSKKWVPFDNNVPELPLNWWLKVWQPPHKSSNLSVYNDIIEEASKVWMNVADVNLRRLPRMNITYFHNIIFWLASPKDGKTFDYDLTNMQRTADFKVATKIKYDAVDAVINTNVTFAEISNELKEKALYFFVHVWGHILGLAHTLDDPNSVMSPFTGNKTDPTLSQEDIADIQTLYGKSITGNGTDPSYLNKKRLDRFSGAKDVCEDSKIDSILEMPDKTWIVFKGSHYHEIGPHGVTPISPRKISWEFPRFGDSVDASLSWGDTLFLFTGNEYYKYKRNNFIVKRKISEGFPGIPDGPFDDVFLWNVNQKTYFFKGGQYWKYDSKKKGVADGFPKKVSDNWKGIPDSFDAAISSRHRNQTYFFKDRQFWRFDDLNKKVVDDTTPPYPRKTDIYFMKCRNRAKIPPKKVLPGQTAEKIPTEPPTPIYDPPVYPPTNKSTANSHQSSDVNENSSWETTLWVICGIALLISVIGGLTFAYLYKYVYIDQAQPPSQPPSQTPSQPSSPSPQTAPLAQGESDLSTSPAPSPTSLKSSKSGKNSSDEAVNKRSDEEEFQTTKL